MRNYDLTVTQQEVSEYFSSVDLGNAATRNIFARVQLLPTGSVNAVMYYLVHHKLTIAQLSQIDINPKAVDALLETLDVVNATDPEIHFRDLLSSKYDSSSYPTRISSKASARLSRSTTSSLSFAKEVKVDSLGVDTTKFRNLAAARTKYDAILAGNILIQNAHALMMAAIAGYLPEVGFLPYPFMNTEPIELTSTGRFTLVNEPFAETVEVYMNGQLILRDVDFSQVSSQMWSVNRPFDPEDVFFATYYCKNIAEGQFDFAAFIAKVKALVNQYEFMHGANLPTLNLQSFSTLSGFLIRNIHNDIPEMRVKAFLDYTRGRCVVAHGVSPDPTGYHAMREVFAENPWSLLTPTLMNDPTAFIDQLIQCYHARITIPSLFVSQNFPSEIVDIEKANFDKLIVVFNAMSVWLNVISSAIKENLVP